MSHGVGVDVSENKDAGPRASMSAVDALGNGDPFLDEV